MPANGRWDLIRRLKVKGLGQQKHSDPVCSEEALYHTVGFRP